MEEKNKVTVQPTIQEPKKTLVINREASRRLILGHLGINTTSIKALNGMQGPAMPSGAPQLQLSKVHNLPTQ